MKDFIIENHLYLMYGFEFLAALTGLFYLKNQKYPTEGIRFFTYYLWFIVVMDGIGTLYPLFEKHLPSLNGTPFENNIWLYNILQVIIFSVYVQFFRFYLKNNSNRRLLEFLLVIFWIYSFFDFVFLGEYWNLLSPGVVIGGSLLTFLSVILYYIELMLGTEILNFAKKFEFYVSIGVLVYSLAFTPLIIYYGYIKKDNLYSDFYIWSITVGNIFLYSILILGYYLNYKYDHSIKLKNFIL